MHAEKFSPSDCAHNGCKNQQYYRYTMMTLDHSSLFDVENPKHQRQQNQDQRKLILPFPLLNYLSYDDSRKKNRNTYIAPMQHTLILFFTTTIQAVTQKRSHRYRREAREQSG